MYKIGSVFAYRDCYDDEPTVIRIVGYRDERLLIQKVSITEVSIFTWFEQLMADKVAGDNEDYITCFEQGLPSAGCPDFFIDRKWLSDNLVDPEIYDGIADKDSEDWIIYNRERYCRILPEQFSEDLAKLC